MVEARSTRVESEFQAIVLAAGRGSRMGSDLPKVLLPVYGKPMVAHILDLLAKVGICSPVVVVGKGGDLVREALGDCCLYADQPEQRGSGHAVICAREAASGSRHVLVMCGDSPLFRVETVRALMEAHLSEGAAVSLVSATLDDPHGYGRILRAPDGSVVGVVEEKIATEAQRAILEINGGCYAFRSDWLWANIDQMPVNEVGEQCLTSMVDIAIEQGLRVIAAPCSADEVAGVNTPEQLRSAEAALASRDVGV